MRWYAAVSPGVGRCGCCRFLVGRLVAFINQGGVLPEELMGRKTPCASPVLTNLLFSAECVSQTHGNKVYLAVIVVAGKIGRTFVPYTGIDVILST
jgi:hypothetical protein